MSSTQNLESAHVSLMAYLEATKVVQVKYIHGNDTMRRPTLEEIQKHILPIPDYFWAPSNIIQGAEICCIDTIGLVYRAKEDLMIVQLGENDYLEMKEWAELNKLHILTFKDW